MSVNENKKKARELFKAYNENDLEKIKAINHEDHHIRYFQSEKVMMNYDIAEYIEGFKNIKFNYVIKNIVAERETVMLSLVANHTYPENFKGTPTLRKSIHSRKSVNFVQYFTFEFKDGQILYTDILQDRIKQFEDLGISTEPSLKERGSEYIQRLKEMGLI